MNAMFSKIDLDGNGTIDYTEFIMAALNEKKLITLDRLKMAFHMLSQNNEIIKLE